jgi:hypothetical protein
VSILFTLIKWPFNSYLKNIAHREIDIKTWSICKRKMEFYSAMRKNEILSFAGKWMELEIILSKLARLRRPKIVCSPSYVDFRSRANAAMLLDLGRTLRGEHIQEE